MLESTYKTGLCKRLRNRFPEWYIIHPNPGEIQGFPDLLILSDIPWYAALEGKQEENSHHQPNQDYYVRDLGRKSFASFIWPGNEEEVIKAMIDSYNVAKQILETGGYDGYYMAQSREPGRNACDPRTV